MKLLLHMGMTKTGTTALQTALHAADQGLRARKVLYPRFDNLMVPHHLLMVLCGQASRLPPATLDRLGGPEAASHKAQAAWDRMVDDLQADRPEILILSSEFLLDRTDHPAKTRLAALLSGVADDVVPIVYVRHPVAHYRSILQESLKVHNAPRPPGNLQLRTGIQDIEAAFSRPPVLVAYDRRTLFQGDIVPDFANRFLVPMVGPADLPPCEANIGLSAEALVLMARLRAEAGNNPDAARQVTRLKGRLLDLDRLDPPDGPVQLLPEVAEVALRAATCHRWLAETGRLDIPGLELDRIDGAAVPDWMLTASPHILLQHDPLRLARLERALQTADQGSKPRGGSPQKQPAPSPLNRFLVSLHHRIGAVMGRSPPTSARADRKGNAPPNDTDPAE